jgi:hypothetical protein
MSELIKVQSLKTLFVMGFYRRSVVIHKQFKIRN